MTGKQIHLAQGLSLDAEELLTSATGIVGKRGRGKSGAVKRLMEELVRVSLPFVCFDPAGIHWAIRSSADGKGPSGLQVLVIGGKHGDIALNRRGGAQVARAIVQGNVSCVIDFKTEPRAAYREFIRDFCHELFRIEGDPRVIIIEEATRLVPQKIYKGGEEVFEAVEKLVSQGRNEGIGVVLVTQRPATLNKDVLSEIDLLLAFGLVSPQDRKAIREWVEVYGKEDQLAKFDAGIASLGKRECWAWAPEAFGGIFKQVRISDFHTLHGDRTHLRKVGLLTTQPVTTDVSKVIASLGAEMAKIAQEKVDVAEIPKLRAEVARLKAHPQTVPAPPPKVVEKVVVDQKAVDRAVARVRREYEGHGTKMARLERIAAINLQAALKALDDMRPHFTLDLQDEPGLVVNPDPASWRPITPPAPTRGFAEAVAKVPRAPARAPAVGPTLEVAATRVADPLDPDAVPDRTVRLLCLLAERHPDRLTRSQLALAAGMTTSGGAFQAHVSLLKKAEWVEEDLGNRLTVTRAGFVKVGVDPDQIQPHTHEEMLAFWKPRLGDTAEILDLLIEAYPNWMTRQEVADRIGMTASGGAFQAKVAVLLRNELAERQGEAVRAHAKLWPEAG